MSAVWWTIRIAEAALLLGALGLAAWSMRRSRDAAVCESLCCEREANCAAEILRAEKTVGTAERAKTAFLATISHELRTPLNGVIGTADLMLGAPLEAQQRHQLTTIRSSAVSLLAIVNDLLDFSRIEQGAMVLEARLFDPRQPAADVIRIASAHVNDREVELVLDVAPDVPFGVHGDPVRLRQALWSLVSNAVKFTRSGHVVLRVARERRAPEGERAGLKFTVTDTGVGIDGEMRDRIFDRFAQGEAFATRAFGGTGLGLAMTGKLVKLMGGHIEVESERGRGSVFWFSVPLRAEKTPAPPPAGITARILVVERLMPAGDAMKSLLETMQIPCAIAVNSAEVVGQLRAAGERGESFDFVMIDERTAAANEGRLVAAIADDPALRGTKILLLTGQRGAPAQPPWAPGVSAAVIMKPVVSADQILQAIRESSDHHGADSDATPEVEGLVRKRLRLLVAEDNGVNRAVAGGMLQKLGCVVEFAENGAEALRKTRQQGYDLILMDCQMPEMDGWTAAREIRRRDARTPIVALTANATNEDRSRCMQVGMNDYLSKPLRIADLTRVMVRWAE